MPAKPVSKAKAPKPQPSTKKDDKSMASLFEAHWLHDVSLENFAPARAYAPGQRQLEFAVSANQATLPQSSARHFELRLRAHLRHEEDTIALAEISYVGIVGEQHSAVKPATVMQNLYPHAREGLVRVLAVVGHQPPLPETLDREDK